MTELDYKIEDPTEVSIEVSEEDNGDGGDPDVVTMSTGIQFRVKQVGQLALGGITERYQKTKPKPPYVFVEAKGRKEANPEHPNYQEALVMWQLSHGMAVNNFLLLRGAEIIEESISDDVEDWKSDDWQEEMELIGTNPESPRACYLDWLKIVACPETSDVAKLLGAIGRKSSVAQEDVEEAVSKFRR